ncbi:MAG: Dabb family protein [Firmicutes bacterium]|nr:Dabb family protein [Bacillota bacterium]
MFHHIIFYRVKENKKENMQELKKRLLAMPGEISVIKKITVGFNVIHSKRSVDVCLHVVFEKMDDLQIYLDHPFHVKVAEYIGTIKDESYSADFYDEV